MVVATKQVVCTTRIFPLCLNPRARKTETRDAHWDDGLELEFPRSLPARAPVVPIQPRFAAR